MLQTGPNDKRWVLAIRSVVGEQYLEALVGKLICNNKVSTALPGNVMPIYLHLKSNKKRDILQ
jgi:hypothetical protein